MQSWLPSFPYPPAQDGYWSPVTSTLNWCEEDYYATVYSAEIVNTLTNLLFVALAFRGISNCVQQGHDQIFLVTFIGYLIVGTGSFLFHSTLKYPMQLVDELSMIYTTCLMFYATFSHKQKTPFKVALAVFLVALCIFITGYYHYLGDPVFHQNMYALLTAIVLFRSMYIMEISLRPNIKAREEAQRSSKKAVNTQEQDLEQQRQDARDRKILKTMWLMIACGLSIFLGGFAIWGLDNVFCSTLRAWRREVGLPWGILLEGHGWWHLMTGTGAYFYIVWGVWLRHCLNGKQDEFELSWPSMFTSLPSVIRKRSGQNGSLKKQN
ncbi:hypothetical protein AAFC00_005477 [Neodothiora populina]|uniref:Alkaline ceramidase-like protein n=1 Tax=Neodothiora populina TaxID=2781224 RepID=A0ABR3PM35_9PEZI